jgi:long-subunit fatty acid transport protein
MRKLILIAAFALASVSAQANEIGSLLAGNDMPAAAASAMPGNPSAMAGAATPQASSKQASSKQASGSKKSQARRETDEQKARRIAAKYGVSW